MSKLAPYYELVHYDGPQVFLAKDEVGTLYLCLKVPDEKRKGLFYLANAISRPRIDALLSGQVDLMFAVSNAERRQWHLLDYGEEGLDIIASIDELQPSMIPGAGFVFDKAHFFNWEVLAEAAELQQTVVHLSLSQDEGDDNTIEVDALADVLRLYQSVVRNVLKKTVANKQIDKSFATKANSNLRAYANSMGSFKLHLVTSSETELFGKAVINKILERVDNLIDADTSQDHVIDNFKPYAGHTVSAFKKLLTKLVDMKVSMRYAWAAPDDIVVKERKIQPRYAETVRDILLTRNDLGKEMRNLVGVVKQVDVDRDTWRIVQTDGKEYRGTSTTPLSGVNVDAERYVFQCEEVIEEEQVSGKEVPMYILKKWSPVGVNE